MDQYGLAANPCQSKVLAPGHRNMTCEPEVHLIWIFHLSFEEKQYNICVIVEWTPESNVTIDRFLCQYPLMDIQVFYILFVVNA